MQAQMEQGRQLLLSAQSEAEVLAGRLGEQESECAGLAAELAQLRAFQDRTEAETANLHVAVSAFAQVLLAAPQAPPPMFDAQAQAQAAVANHAPALTPALTPTPAGSSAATAATTRMLAPEGTAPTLPEEDAGLGDMVAVLELCCKRHTVALEDAYRALTHAQEAELSATKLSTLQARELTQLRAELTRSNQEAAAAFTEARKTAEMLALVQDEARAGLVERQETQKALVEGVAGLELALSKSQGELARLEAEARNHSAFIQRTRDRLKRGTAAAEAAGGSTETVDGTSAAAASNNARSSSKSGKQRKKTQYAKAAAAETISRMPRTTAGEWPLYAEQLDQEVLAITTAISDARARLAAAQEDNRMLDAEVGTFKEQAATLAAENKALIAQLASTDNHRMAALEIAASTKKQAHAAVEQLRKQTSEHAGALQASLEQQVLRAQGEAEDAFASRDTAVAVAKQAVSQFAAMDQQARVLLVAVQHGAGTVLQTMNALRFQKTLALREAATAADQLALVWEWSCSWHASTGGAGPPPPMPNPSMFAATHLRTSPSFRIERGNRDGNGGSGGSDGARRRIPPRTRFKAWVRAVIAVRCFRRLTARKLTAAEQRKMAVSADPAPLDDSAALLVAAAEEGLKSGKSAEQVFRRLVGPSFKMQEILQLAPPQQQHDPWDKRSANSVGNSNSEVTTTLPMWLAVYTKRLKVVTKQELDRHNAVDDTRQALEQQTFDL